MLGRHQRNHAQSNPSGVIMEEKRKAVILNQLSSQNARWGLNPMATELSADVFGSFSS